MPPSRAQMVSLMRSVSSSLKPVDVILLSYLLVTAPLLFVVHDDDDVAWGGFFCRLVIAPLVVTGRYYLAFTDPADLPTSIHIATIRSHKLVFPPALLALLVLDLYPLVVCMYLYAEDGKLIHNLYSSGFFYDRQLHLIDAAVFGVPLEAGLSNYIRSQGSELFNKILGEYLHFCYFAFYFILAGTWPLAWVFCAREHFDAVTSSITVAYLLCLSTYLIIPVKGPFWTYQRPLPGDVGWLFSYLTHAIDEGGSSPGTATPSSHCALTISCWGCALLYMLPLGIAYIFIAPGLVFATVWCGFHYGTDAVLGCMVGVASVIIGHYAVNVVPYRRPQCDSKYLTAAPKQGSERAGTYRLLPLWRDDGSQGDLEAGSF